MIDQKSFDDLENRVEAPDDDLSSDERFFFKLLLDHKIKFIRPQFTSDGVRYDSLSEFTEYYSTNEITQLLESLVNKGYLEKVDYGVVALCPKCQSPTHLAMLVCQRCGSTKVRKMEKIRHHDCGYWGEVGEFVDGFRLRCPSCGEPLNETTTGKDWSVSDPYFECQECGSVVSKDSMRHVCKRCRSVYTPSEASIKNPVGFKVLESRQERTVNAKGSRGTNVMETLLETIEVNQTEDSITDEAVEEPKLSEPEHETVEEQPDDSEPVENLEETTSEVDESKTETFAENPDTIEEETDHPLISETFTVEDDDHIPEKAESPDDSEEVEEPVHVEDEGELDDDTQDMSVEPTVKEVDENIKNWLNELVEQYDAKPDTDGLEPPSEETKLIEQEEASSDAFDESETDSVEDDVLEGREEQEKLIENDNEVIESEKVNHLEEITEQTTDASISDNPVTADLKDDFSGNSENIEPPRQEEVSPFDPWEDIEYILSMDPKIEPEKIDEQTIPETDKNDDIHRREEIIQESNIETFSKDHLTVLEEATEDSLAEVLEENKDTDEISLLENKSEEIYLLTHIENLTTAESKIFEKSTDIDSTIEESEKDHGSQIKTEPSEVLEEAVNMIEEDLSHLNEDAEYQNTTKDGIKTELVNTINITEEKEDVESELKTGSGSLVKIYSSDDDFEDYKKAFELNEKDDKESGKLKLNEDVDEDYLDYLRSFGMIDEPDQSPNQREDDLEDLFDHVENEIEPVTEKVEEEDGNLSIESPGRIDESPEIGEEDSYNAAFRDVEDFLQYVTKQTGKTNKDKAKLKNREKETEVLTDQTNHDMHEVVTE